MSNVTISLLEEDYPSDIPSDTKKDCIGCYSCLGYVGLFVIGVAIILFAYFFWK